MTAPAGSVTLVEGSTFCLSNTHGDIVPGTAHGLFVRNTRFLSRYELLLDGQTPEALSVQTPEAFAAQFVLRRAPRAGFADTGLLLVRERVIGGGLRETITLENLTDETTVVSLEVHVDADFADLYAVKEGRAPLHGAEPTVFGTELVLTDLADPLRTLPVIASADPTVIPKVLSWQIVLPGHERWQAEILAQPGQTHAPPPARRSRTGETASPARKLGAWRDTATDLSADDPVLAQVLRRTESDLGALLIRDDDAGAGPFVAAGAPWFMTLFGRDSLLTAWMALPLDVGLAIGTLRRLARLQGRHVDPMTEEQPGRILHELRRGSGTDDTRGGVACYGSVDATPLFVMLLAEAWRWGADEAAVRALLPAADAALAWAEKYGDRDGDCFIEYQRATTCGPIHQGWKDSDDAINDAEGHPAEPPIALCEVQGYHYAALLGRAELAEAFGDPAAASRLRDQADTLRGKFLEEFWLPEKGWYAVALDGGKRRVDALTSNVAHCLWTGIATDQHAADIVERLSGEQMDSGFGLRTLATTMGAYNPMSYHNGSVWPHDTAIAVAGLLRYRHVPGAVELAERLASGLLDAADAFDGRLPELFCGFSRSRFVRPVPYPTACAPQGWASAAPLLLVRSFLGLEPHTPKRTLTVIPRLPQRWGKLALTELRLGPATVHIEAQGTAVTSRGLPDDWRLVTSARNGTSASTC
ncbi:amylo-alpha-1,6-glucosidase [Acidothermus cellulolyticus 11B] [Mycobacterium shimoidei]|uniref:Amylo-alpha-1,6-glucosidase [Acidothermus cellulolyticus 11B] n=1 Tax=Mycobacterium shimoidei TaxID=29313 RepID=A0A375YW06_MYCSH|nr:glycogen debranching N-terminal domain-containing protein [Mycobacterium shimoidei]SRX93039.1 amylo-alpha-1,6-glucosidase [Acidothermus cellulolyticus 11B] [Mycobacterium shimoidei]